MIATIKAAPKLDYKSKENRSVIKNTPEKFTFKTAIKNSILKIPLETTVFRSPSMHGSTSNLNESNEYQLRLHLQ